MTRLSNLCSQVTRLAAGWAVILAIFAQADAVLRLAKAAIPFTVTFFFRKFAHRAKIFFGHERRLSRFVPGCKPMITYLVPLDVSDEFCRPDTRLAKESFCPQRWKPKRCGRLRSTACTASPAPKWWISADGICPSNI